MAWRVAKRVREGGRGARGGAGRGGVGICDDVFGAQFIPRKPSGGGDPGSPGPTAVADPPWVGEAWLGPGERRVRQLHIPFVHLAQSPRIASASASRPLRLAAMSALRSAVAAARSGRSGPKRGLPPSWTTAHHPPGSPPPAPHAQPSRTTPRDPMQLASSSTCRASEVAAMSGPSASASTADAARAKRSRVSRSK